MLFAGTAHATEPQSVDAPAVSIETLETWVNELSNWGRWGKDDELGTLNLITPEKRLQAVSLVRDGVPVSASRLLSKKPDPISGQVTFHHTLAKVAHGGGDFAGDRYTIEYHGWNHSHIDSLAHMAWKGRLYNGFDAATVVATNPENPSVEAGARKLGVQVMADGIVSRAILVDMPGLKGADYLAPGTAVTAQDLESWEKKAGLTIGAGDILLLRVGLPAYHEATGDVANPRRAGLHVSAVKWLKERDVAVLGCDANSDAIPSGVEGLDHPVHMLVLHALGMPILDNLDLSRLSQVAADKNRWEFMMVITPLAVPGGTGSPVNALAIF
ncbi:cyclase family protein [Kordiimonas aestuarii]|uniref:cyclase family protein n=1 Tax=Kordiimonas aestuarii TaxID=1005925 RepID=UPI0021D35F75|nr:cyclase family protein [Kordiimonas aestuarii]